MNIASIGRICKEWSREQSTQKTMFFENLPDYLKEIVSGIELYRRKKPESISTLLSTLEKHRDQELFYAVTPRGIVVLREKSSLAPDERKLWVDQSVVGHSSSSAFTPSL